MAFRHAIMHLDADLRLPPQPRDGEVPSIRLPRQGSRGRTRVAIDHPTCLTHPSKWSPRRSGQSGRQPTPERGRLPRHQIGPRRQAQRNPEGPEKCEASASWLPPRRCPSAQAVRSRRRCPSKPPPLDSALAAPCAVPDAPDVADYDVWQDWMAAVALRTGRLYGTPSQGCGCLKDTCLAKESLDKPSADLFALSPYLAC